MKIVSCAHVGAGSRQGLMGRIAATMWIAAVACAGLWASPTWAESVSTAAAPPLEVSVQDAEPPLDDAERSASIGSDTDQTEDGEEPGNEASASGTDGEEAPDRASQLAGPGSVKGQIYADAKMRKIERLQTSKERLQSEYGLTLGADLNVLMQQINESPGSNDGVTGVARFYGHWALVGRDDPTDVGSLVFKVEYRGKLGTDIPAQVVLPVAGVAGISGPTFGDNGFMLSNLYWTQAFADNRFAFNAGVVDPTDYLDVFGLVNVWTDFNNLAFSTNPTIAIPNQGLGAVARWMFTPNFYVIGGIADANADPHRPDDFFSTFGEGEYFKHVEFGWIGSWSGRFGDNAHVLLWEVDDREEAGIEGGWGATVSWSAPLNDRWLTFVRGGYSDSGGTIVDRTVSTGFGYTIDDQDSYVGFGINWGRAPADPGDDVRDQFMFETYYRTTIVPGLSVVPSVQYILDPAYNLEVSNLWLLGVRLRAVW